MLGVRSGRQAGYLEAYGDGGNSSKVRRQAGYGVSSVAVTANGAASVGGGGHGGGCCGCGVSARGPPGPPGAPGENGADGEPGGDGQPGMDGIFEGFSLETFC